MDDLGRGQHFDSVKDAKRDFDVVVLVDEHVNVLEDQFELLNPCLQVLVFSKDAFGFQVELGFILKHLGVLRDFQLLPEVVAAHLKQLKSDSFFVEEALELLGSGERRHLRDINPELEQSYVIEGSFQDHDGICKAGEYVWRTAGSKHETYSAEGCVILAVYRKPNLFRSGPAY